MSEVAEQLSAINRIVHEPARLAVLTALVACRSADFTYLERLTGLTRGNLSRHLAKLEEFGLIAAKKRFVDKRPNTQLTITAKGRAAIEKHWQRLEELRHGASRVESTDASRGRDRLARRTSEGKP